MNSEIQSFFGSMEEDEASSDDDYEQTPDEFAEADQRMVTAMLAEASQLRVESKKASAKLQPMNGATITRMQRARWANIWQAFFVNVLGKSPDTVPTGEDIERYLFILPSRMPSSAASRTACSWDSLRLALTKTLHAIRRRHDAFRLTYDERCRILDVFATLLKDGTITKQPTRDAQWVTARIVCQLTRSLLVEAISHGTLDWSVVVHKCLGLALQSALSCRAGDAVVSKYYSDHDCILYKHILMKVSLNPGSASTTPLLDRVRLESRFTLMYTKGKKDDPSNNHVVALTSLDDADCNVVDPLKLLLIHALRQGIISSATTAEQAVQAALQRRDGLIQWLYPERPVLCSLSTKNRFDYSRGATLQQLSQTLKEAGALSGISERLTTHDLRRGAARDASQLHTHPALNMDLAAQALDHGQSTQDRAVTKKYVGHDERSTFQDRLRLKPDAFGLQPADTLGLSRKRKIASADIDDYLARPENASLLKLKSARHAATRAMKAGIPSDSPHDGTDAGDSAKESRRTPNENWTGSATGLLQLSGISSKADTVPIDATILQDLTVTDDANPEPPQHGSSLTAAETEVQHLVAAPSIFIPWLSRINTRVINDTNPKQHNDLEYMRGGSRDEVTWFFHHCRFESDGCTYSTTSGPSLVYHEKTCTPMRRQQNAAMTLTRKCDEPDCDYVARADTDKKVTKKMSRHKNENHVEREPVSCPIGGQPECLLEFKNQAALSRHKYKLHQPITPQLCPVSGCRSKTKWAASWSLADHIRKTHYLKGQPLADLVASAKALQPACDDDEPVRDDDEPVRDDYEPVCDDEPAEYDE